MSYFEFLVQYGDRIVRVGDRDATDWETALVAMLEEMVDELEERALNDPTPNLLQEISHKKRELLNLRRIVGPQREVLAQLTSKADTAAA